MAGLQAQRVKPAYEGMNTEAAPDYLGDAQAPLVENLLCRTGKLVMRGPIHHASADLPNVALTVPVRSSMVAVGENLLLAHVDAAHNNYRINTTESGVSTVAALVGITSANMMLEPSVQMGNYAYGRTLGLTTARWDGTTTAPTVYADTAMPTVFSDAAAFAERVWLADAAFEGVTTLGRLMWSDPGGPSTAPAAADWKDDVSGLTNQLIVGIEGEPIVALVVHDRALMVFKAHRTYVITGSGSSSFAVRQVSNSIGCIDRASVVSAAGYVFFLSDDGYYRYDGAGFEKVSRAIEPDMNAVVSAVHSTYGCYAMAVRGSAILLTVHENILTGSGSALFQALYDVQRNAWSKFSTTATKADGCVLIGKQVPLNGHTLATDGYNGFMLTDIAASPATDGAGGRKSMLDVIGSTTSSITAKWHSRLIKLVSPVSATQLKRIMLDYRMDIGAGVAGWYVSLLRGDGTPAVTEYQVPGEAAGAPTYLARRRSSDDTSAEVVDVQLRVEWRDAGTTAFTQAEIYDATIEYQGTRDRVDS